MGQFNMALTWCEICNRPRSKGKHDTCSKIRQQRCDEERSKQKERKDG